MPHDEHIKGKNIEELLAKLGNSFDIDSPVKDQIKMAIFARSTESLEQAIITSAESSRALGTKVLFLDIILTIATVIGLFITVWKYLN